MRPHSRTGAAVAALLTCLPPAALAQTGPGDPTADAALLDDVVVTATRTPQPADRIGQSVTVLTEASIVTAQAVSVADLLAREPGVSQSRNGGPGQVTSLRIRGAEADQTVVVIDGVKLNDPSTPGSGYNFGNLLVGDIGRIEVLRGAQSTLWGSQAIGGVVNIVSRRAQAPFEASLDAEAGSRATRFVRGGLGGAGERLLWRVAASRYETDGVSAFGRGRETDAFENSGLSGRAEVRLTDAASVDLRAVWSDSTVGFDGFPPPTFAFGDTRDFGTTEELVIYAGLNFGLLDGRWRNRIGYGRTRTDRQTLNPAQAVTPVTFDAEGLNRRYEYQGVLDVRDGWTATFGAERENSAFTTASPSAINPNPRPATAEATIDGVYTQLQAEVTGGLTLTGGVRRDQHDSFGGRTLGQAAAAWSLNGGSTLLRASFGQGFKAPTLFQLFSDFGNPDLRPEEADGWDAGVEQRWLAGRLIVAATWFQRDTENQIDFASCSTTATPATAPLCFRNGVRRFGFYQNLARTQARGLELAAAVEVAGVEIQANYTLTETENRTPGAAFGRWLARRPRETANVSASHVWPGGLATTVVVQHVGESFDNATNSVRLEGYTLVDLRAAYPLTDALELYGRVENLGDETYETTAGYGAPGRGTFLGVRARF